MEVIDFQSGHMDTLSCDVRVTLFPTRDRAGLDGWQLANPAHECTVASGGRFEAAQNLLAEMDEYGVERRCELLALPSLYQLCRLALCPRCDVVQLGRPRTHFGRLHNIDTISTRHTGWPDSVLQRTMGGVLLLHASCPKPARVVWSWKFQYVRT